MKNTHLLFNTFNLDTFKDFNFYKFLYCESRNNKFSIAWINLIGLQKSEENNQLYYDINESRSFTLAQGDGPIGAKYARVIGYVHWLKQIKYKNILLYQKQDPVSTGHQRCFTFFLI